MNWFVSESEEIMVVPLMNLAGNVGLVAFFLRDKFSSEGVGFRLQWLLSFSLHFYSIYLFIVCQGAAPALNYLIAFILSFPISIKVFWFLTEWILLAILSSEAIGAQIVLGDRPIEITLERAWNSLRWTEKRSLVLSVVRGITSPPPYQFQNNVEESSEDNGTFQLYEQLIFSYPSLLDPLIHERDTYLALSLKQSKAVNRSKGVVGVIGKGHMNGVIYALISYQGNLRFRDLAGGKRPFANASNGWIGRLLNSLIRDTIIGFLLWELYEQIKGLTLIYNIGLTLLEIKKSFRDVDDVLYDSADSPSSNYCVWRGALVTMSPSVLSVLSFNVIGFRV
ncbi:hypothetical protein UlMin_033004 [Ulmus minor]